MRASRKKRVADSGVRATSGRRTLMATRLSVNVCVASHTVAMPPAPMIRRSWYFPARSCPSFIFGLRHRVASRDGHTSVDHKGLSRQETGGVARQVEGAPRDFLG